MGSVAKITGASSRTVQNWFRKGLLHGFRVPGTTHRRVYEDVLVRFMMEYEMRVPEQMMHRYKASQPKGV